jgi:sugar lactone lactonase YvrE
MNIESNVNEMVNVVVTNMVGEVVKEIKVPTNTPSNVTLSQPAGVYMVSASTGNGRYTARVVVAK